MGNKVLPVLFSTSLSNNIASVIALMESNCRLSHLSVGLCVCRFVSLSVCLTGKCTVAKRLIGSGCGSGW